jgi:protein tyrosine phosphatase (PTP) superfamily phosphohydrolase (DUF442 family)
VIAAWVPVMPCGVTDSVVVDFAPAMNAFVSNVLNANSTSTTRAFSLVQFYLFLAPMERDSDSK